MFQFKMFNYFRDHQDIWFSFVICKTILQLFVWLKQKHKKHLFLNRTQKQYVYN